MHTLIPTSEGFLAGQGNVLARWDGTTGTSLVNSSNYADPIQHAYHSDKVLLVNGLMTPAEFSGGSLTSLNFTSGITTASELIGVTVFKGRAFYWKSESGFYYANAGSYQGDLAYFDIAAFSEGEVVFCFTYSTDAGDGTDDMFVVITNSGDVLVYQGNDPADVENWQMISKYKMPPPLGVRGHCDYIGDHIILTAQGWINFDHVVKMGNAPGGIAHKIVDLVKSSVAGGTDTHLWEVHYVANKGLIVVTTLQSGVHVQHVMNTLTGAWCTFSGLDSLVWAVKDGEAYYLDTGVIYQYSGYTGTVTADAIPAYTQLGSDGFQRQVTGIRPVTNADPEKLGIDASADFNNVAAPTPTLDTTSHDIDGYWKSLNRFAYNLTYRMTLQTSGHERRWYSTQVMFKQGGPV